ncbi:MAG: thiolase domain-containing protein [Candidatus Anstonellales archaeon]
MRRVAVIGIGITKFGEHWDKGLRELALEAGIKAITDAGLEGEKIDAGYLGNMAAGSFALQEHLGALLADQLGLNPIPVTKVEAACASGAVAFRQAYLSVASGAHDIVVAGGVEKMTDLDTETVTKILAAAGDQEWEAFQGATFPALYALMMRAYMLKYGAKEEDFAYVAVKNHKHAKNVEYAQFRNEITVEQVMESKYVAEPIKVLDSSPITDGAAAVILAPLDIAYSYTSEPIEVLASAQASDTIALHDREDITFLKATSIASQKAYAQANISPSQIDIAEVHDAFTIGEVLALEALGIFERGTAYRAAREGLTTYGGEIVVNPSGGLKAAGHPVGATGIKQIYEIVLQLRGKAGARQVKNASYGLANNVGGSGATSVVHIFGKVY